MFINPGRCAGLEITLTLTLKSRVANIIDRDWYDNAIKVMDFSGNMDMQGDMYWTRDNLSINKIIHGASPAHGTLALAVENLQATTQPLRSPLARI